MKVSKTRKLGWNVVNERAERDFKQVLWLVKKIER